MDNIEIKKQNVIKAFLEGSAEIKKVLQNLFGSDLFNNKWIEKWRSFCQENDLTVSLPYTDPKNSLEESANAYIMLTHIAKIKNAGWEPDWDNSNQYKYYPWFTMSGSRFSCDDCVRGYSLSTLGSRLCFKSKELAESVGKEFISIYEKFLTK